VSFIDRLILGAVAEAHRRTLNREQRKAVDHFYRELLAERLDEIEQGLRKRAEWYDDLACHQRPQFTAQGGSRVR
jgi:Arc/MetJ family transcription regulator